MTSANPREATEKYLRDIINKYYVYVKDIDDQAAQTDKTTGKKIPTKTSQEITKLEGERAKDIQTLIEDFHKEYEKSLKEVQKEAKKTPLTTGQTDAQATAKAVQRWNSKNLYGDRKADEKLKADKDLTLFVKGENDVNEVELNDVSQGKIGDCYILAGIGSFAKQHPEKIKNIITDNGDGTFSVKIYKPDLKGNYVETIQKVDGKLKGDGHALYGDTAKINGIQQKEAWTVLIEKAYIQAYGSYKDAGKGGAAKDVITALSGKEAKIFKTADLQTTDIKKYLNEGKAIALSSPEEVKEIQNGKLRDKFVNDYKLITQHAYVLSEIKQDAKGNDIAVIYNPWGNSQEIPLDEVKDLFRYVQIEQ